MATTSADVSVSFNGNDNSNDDHHGHGNGKSGNNTKTVVTFSPPVVAAALNAAPPSMSGSMLTISSVPTSLMFGAASTPTGGGQSVSAATTPMATNSNVSATSTKRCSFALTPLIPPPPAPGQLAFLTTAGFHANIRRGTAAVLMTATPLTTSASTTLMPPATASAPSLIETVGNLAQTPLTPLHTPLTPSSHATLAQHSKHSPMEAQHTALSQLTSLKDMEEKRLAKC